MIDPHPYFELPPDDTIVWRYMDLTSFFYLLEKGSLYFRRADKLKDPYEGTPSLFNLTQWGDNYLNPVQNNGFAKARELYKGMRAQTFVNCWHLNNVESAAMWDLYTKYGEGIAIKSTVSTLTNMFTGDTKPDIIGKVVYLDYNSEWMPEENLYYPIFSKRSSFKHEQELRIVYHEKDY